MTIDDFRCPLCGLWMRQTRRGATLAKRGPAYVCPQDEAETWTDETGKKHRLPDEKRLHGRSVHVWEANELIRERLP